MQKVLKLSILAFLFLAFIIFSGQVLAENNYDASAEIQLLNNQLQNKRKQLNQIKEEQDQYNKLIASYQNSQATLANQLAILENRISKAELDIAEANLNIDQTNLEIRKLGLDIQAKDQEIENEKNHLGNLLKLVYKQDQASTLEILLLHNSLGEFLNQVRYLEDTNEEISNSLDDLKGHKSVLEQDQKRLVAKGEELKVQKENLEKKKNALAYEQDSKVAILAATEDKEEKYQSLLSEAQQQYNQANAEISSLENTVRQRLAQLDGTKLEISDNGFIWPVPQSYITTSFHDPDYPFRRIIGEHSAIDIRAAQGTPLKAAASGYVARVKFDGSTNYAYIMIIHANGLSTVYGHVSAVNVKPDQYVIQGQVIGATGAQPGTPGAGPFTTGPHLHFEIRKDGIPVNPEDYLP